MRSALARDVYWVAGGRAAPVGMRVPFGYSRDGPVFQPAHIWHARLPGASCILECAALDIKLPRGYRERRENAV